MHAMKKNSFQQIHLTEDEYNGHPFLDVRIYVKGEGGKYYPTRQGLAVPLERVDAFAARWIVRALGLAGNEARVIDEKVYVRVALGDDANIARQAVLVGAPAERQAFVDADVAHAEGAGPLD